MMRAIRTGVREFSKEFDSIKLQKRRKWAILSPEKLVEAYIGIPPNFALDDVDDLAQKIIIKKHNLDKICGSENTYDQLIDLHTKSAYCRLEMSKIRYGQSLFPTSGEECISFIAFPVMGFFMGGLFHSFFVIGPEGNGLFVSATICGAIGYWCAVSRKSRPAARQLFRSINDVNVVECLKKMRSKSVNQKQ